MRKYELLAQYGKTKTFFGLRMNFQISIQYAKTLTFLEISNEILDDTLRRKYHKKKTEDSSQDLRTQDRKEYLRENLNEDPITEDTKENPITDNTKEDHSEEPIPQDSLN